MMPVEKKEKKWYTYSNIAQVKTLAKFSGGEAHLKATQADIALLERLYQGKNAYHGEMHDHSKSGWKSDGKELFIDWKNEIMPEKAIDFATIVDHKQSMHMRLPEWDDTMFIGGTEAGTMILSDKLEKGSMHYNMIFDDPEKQDQLVSEFAEYKFSGGDKGTFVYPRFEPDRFRKVVKRIRELGGFFVHVHPKYRSYMHSKDPEGYLFGEKTGLEVMTGHGGNMTRKENMDAYRLWVDLINLGHVVYATSGSDSHRRSTTCSLATVYSEKRSAHTYLEYFREGNITAGPVGIRIAVGDTCTGGTTDFAGKRLVVSVGDFHCQERKPDHQYRVDVYNEKGLVFSQAFDNSKTAYFAINADNCRYYRANVYDVTEGYLFAIGNPVWNSNFK